jgi:hypothetical protein
MFPSLKNVNPKPRRARLGLETLSAREVPAVVASWFPTTGELVVTGTDFGDTIFVQEMAGQVSVPGVPIRVRTGAWTRFRRPWLPALRLMAGAGTTP